MNKKYKLQSASLAKRSLLALVVAGSCYALLSFTSAKMTNDFMQLLGISKPEADEKVAGSFIDGYLYTYGVKNIKALPEAQQLAVAKELLAYTKEYVKSAAFKKKYDDVKAGYKPGDDGAPATPEQQRKTMIEQAEESVTKLEAAVKDASEENKKLFQPALDAAKQYLADAQDENNEYAKMYASNYELLLQQYENDKAERLKKWNEEYPANAELFVKKRLQEFLNATNGVDFSAETYTKNGKVYFVKDEYERKDYRWKMAYRAGQNVVETSRAFVEQWIAEIQ